MIEPKPGVSASHHPANTAVGSLQISQEFFTSRVPYIFALCSDATLWLSRVARDEHPLVVVDARCCWLHPSRDHMGVSV